MSKQTDKIMDLVLEQKETLEARLEQAGARADHLAEEAVAYDALLDRQGHVQPFEERRLDRLNDLSKRSEDLAFKLERRVELLGRALSLLEEEADVFGRVKPLSLADMVRTSSRPAGPLEVLGAELRGGL